MTWRPGASPYRRDVRLDPRRWHSPVVAGLPTTDAALAGLLLVIAVASAASGNPDEGPALVTVPVAVVMAGSLAWRSRAPLASLAAILLASSVQTLLADTPGSLWSFAVYLIAAFSVASCCEESRAWLGGGALVGVLWLQELHDHGSDYLFVVVVFGGTWLLGRVVRSWRDRATAAEQDQQARAVSAVADERARIARELHDVVAHAVSVIAIQSDAAEAALDRDPELAREPLRAIKDSSREALAEMRRMLTLRDDEPGLRAPQPGLGALGTLVDSVRQAGLPVELTLDGPVEHLAPGVDLAAYRIVQEALTNVLKHAGAVPTRVVVRYSREEVCLDIYNACPDHPVPPHPDAGGRGLPGIRERAAVAGGELSAAPDGAGGFRVLARLPRGERA